MAWMLTVMMTRRHVVRDIGRITGCKRTPSRALPSAKNQRHDQQCGELVRRLGQLSRS
jgi:hypothetical protein